MLVELVEFDFNLITDSHKNQTKVQVLLVEKQLFLDMLQRTRFVREVCDATVNLSQVQGFLVIVSKIFREKNSSIKHISSPRLEALADLAGWQAHLVLS